MATGKVFYWIKIRDSFLESDAVDFLMSQKDGANYIVLYQAICLKTMNTKGELGRQLGEVLIPYDAAKIARDTKWFSIDTVRVALELYKKIGLVFEQDNGILKIADYERMVGHDTDWAEKKKFQRLTDKGRDNVPTCVPTNVPTCVPTNVPTEIENRDKSKNLDIRVKNNPSSVPSEVLFKESLINLDKPDKPKFAQGFVEQLFKHGYLVRPEDDPEIYRYTELFQSLLTEYGYKISNLNQSFKYAMLFANTDRIIDKYNWLLTTLHNNCQKFIDGYTFPDYDPSANAKELMVKAIEAGWIQSGEDVCH